MAALFLTLTVFSALIFIIGTVENIAFSAVLAVFLMLALWVGIAISGIAQCVAIVTPGAWKPDIRANWVMAAVLITGFTLPLFQLFKQKILPVRGFPLDPYVAAIDRFLLGGNDAWMVTHAVFGSVGITQFFDAVYAIWLPMMFAFPVVMVMAAHDIRLRARLLGCWVASWVLIAGLGAWLFGSAGPCYYTRLVGPDAGFAGLDAQLARLNATAQLGGTDLAALHFQSLLLAGQSATELMPAGGISAMPSMHVAMATLFALAAKQIARPLGYIFTAYVILIWVASIHLGWHYAIDGIVGSAMMVGLWKLSGKFVAR